MNELTTFELILPLIPVCFLFLYAAWLRYNAEIKHAEINEKILMLEYEIKKQKFEDEE